MKKLLSFALSVVMALGLFAGCGEKQTNDNNPGSPGQNNEDRTLVVRKSINMVSTDYALTTTSEDMAVLWTHVFQGLYGIDEAAGDYRKELAKDVTISEDGLIYTITLVDANFQNGDPLKASDVVFSYNRAMENARFNSVTEMLDKVEALGDKTVQITLKYPYSPISHTFFSVRICSEREVTEAGDLFGTQPHKAGTGPYYIESYDPAGTVVLKANEDFYGGAPAIKTIRLVTISDDSAAVIAFENGEIDFMTNAPTAEWDALVEASNGCNTVLQGNNIRVLYINYKSPTNNNVLGNEYVRKAICYAINKDAINTVAAGGLGNVTTEFIPSSYVATSPDESTFETYPYSVEKAKEMLRLAGYSDTEIANGINIGMISTYGSATGEKAKAAQVIQSNLREVGLIAEIEVQDSTVICPRFRAFDYDLGIYGDSGNYDFNNIRQQVLVDGGYQALDYSDSSVLDYEKAKELLQEGVELTDTQERLAVYTELWNMVMDTATIYPFMNMPVCVVWSEGLNPGDATQSPTYYHFDTMSWK